MIRALRCIEFDPEFNVLSIEENQQSQIHHAVPGLHFMIISVVSSLQTLRLSQVNNTK
jgi:hypothetical protein